MGTSVGSRSPQLKLHLDDKDKGRVLDACKLGDRCEIKGTIRGHAGRFMSTRLMQIFASLDEDYVKVMDDNASRFTLSDWETVRR
jgi:hypothetical protein